MRSACSCPPVHLGRGGWGSTSHLSLGCGACSCSWAAFRSAPWPDFTFRSSAHGAVELEELVSARLRLPPAGLGGGRRVGGCFLGFHFFVFLYFLSGEGDHPAARGLALIVCNK